MPSYAGRYRSRLFNFLSQQTRRWVDKSEIALRQIKVGATWGAQILIYPIYVMVQAARVAGRQLKQAVQQNSDSDIQHLPPSDAPLQKVLTSAIAFSPVNLASDTQTDREIQGIASQVQTHNLVLVNSHNQIEGAFTSQQQQELEKLIKLEIADYLHQRILAQTAKTKIINQLPVLDDRPHLLPPIRWFRKAIAWVQTGPVATLVNLFQEEKVVETLESRTQQLKLKSQELKLRSEQLRIRSEEWQNKTQPPDFLLKLDTAIAELESSKLSTIVHHTQEFLHVAKHRSPETAINVPPANLDDPQANPFKIQALIQAAIDYFFGGDRETTLPSQPASAISGSAELEIVEEDPWVTENELFGDSIIINPIDNNNFRRRDPQTFSLPEENSAAIASLPPNNKRSANMVAARSTTLQQTEKEVVTAPSVMSDSFSSMERDDSDFYYYDSDSDWIEIKAKPAGYIKHPLEQILEWLDALMLKLEEAIGKIWQELQRILTKKK